MPSFEERLAALRRGDTSFDDKLTTVRTTEPTVAETAQERLEKLRPQNRAGNPLDTTFAQEAADTPLGGLVVGALKGAGTTAYNLGKLVHRGASAVGTAPQDAVAAFDKPNPLLAALKPKGAWEAAGHTAEQVGEFFVPGGSKAGVLAPIAKQVGKLGVIGRIGTEAVNAAAVTGAQGGDPLAGGVAGGVGAGVGAGMQKLAPAVANSMLGAKTRLFKTGANAGEAIANEGIVAATTAGLVEKISAARKSAGQAISNAMNSLPHAKTATIDLSAAVLDPIVSAAQAMESVGNKAGVNRLVALATGIEDALAKTGGGVSAATPAQAHKIRMLIDAGIKHGGTEGAEASVQEVTKTIRRNVAEAIAGAVPEIKPLNRRYADLAAAQDAAWDKLNASHGIPIGPLGRGTVAGVAGYLLGGQEGAGAGALGSAAMSSPLFGGATAVGLRALGGPTMGRIAGAAASSATQPDYEEEYLRSLMTGPGQR